MNKKKSTAFDFFTAKPNQHSKEEFEFCIGCRRFCKDTIKIMNGVCEKWKPQFICSFCVESLSIRFRDFKENKK